MKYELSHYLKGRNRSAHLAALKVCATSARWSEVKGAIQARRRQGSRHSVNDATVHNVLESLKAAMLIEEERQQEGAVGGGVYTVRDPMLRTLLLTTRLT